MNISSILTVMLISMSISFGSSDVAFTQMDIDAERKILLDTDYEFARTSVKKGPSAAFYLYLADNAMQLPEGSLPIYGRTAIYETMKGDHYDLLWTPVKAEVARSGELGWTWGKYVVVIRNSDGTETKMYGKYLNIWRKQTDGKWKVIVDMGNASPSPN
ncbi:MAG: DUF4440 domain-containing protein [Candidatus Marinimicrobia bacterium]|nr:DUF4440 domain-containing protein [Candidatus Neomarinimicrobiota bacterium]